MRDAQTFDLQAPSPISTDVNNSSVDTTEGRLWWRWLATLLGVAAVLPAVGYVAIILIDPFATGRLTPIKRFDVAAPDVALGHAARVRDPQFDSAVIGNSHAVLIDPARLSEATHLHVAQLAFVAAPPREQFILARAFLSNHPKAEALIVTLDERSCQANDDPVRPAAQFPAFLFEGSDFDYVTHLQTIYVDALDAAARRVAMLLGLAAAPRRGDGFEPMGYSEKTRPERLLRIAAALRPTDGPDPDAPLPALVRLEALAADSNPDTILLLYFTPLPLNSLPAPESKAARRLDFCKSRYRNFAASRPNTTLIDGMVEDDFTRDINNFENSNHLRNNAGPVLEADIVAALRRLLVTRVSNQLAAQ
jgi:hypothetical protein